MAEQPDPSGGSPIRLRIGSERRTGIGVAAIRSPYDGALLGEVCVGGARDVDDACAAAAAAFPATKRMPTHARVAVLERTAHALRERAEEFAVRLAREAGKPIRFARGEAARAAVTFELAAAECRTARGEVLAVDLEERAEGRLCLSERVPLGPVAAISPFNFPLNLVAHKVAPAIAVGASLVLKPPPQCPLTAFALAELIDAAGWPAGGLNVVHCSPQDAQRMVTDERLAVLSFTGSDTVGWKLKELAGRKQVLLELGGNAPCVIDEGVALASVLDPILLACWAYAGQVCIRIQRVLVHASLYERFLAAFVERTRALACGDPMDEATVVGPLIETRHVERVLEWVREAVAGGARLHCGGERRGSVVLPVILTGVQPHMRVCKDEVFGPVTVVERFETFDQALELCNATRFGLQAGIFTHDIARALRAFRELDYGGVLINEVPTFRVDNYPYGGTKQSGFGREGVRYAMQAMTESKVLVARGL
jgi:acyl-CoA reductase-like NAD-dependent aldehyde dehydrogenase